MTIDCHAHVINPARFPYAPGPGYKPRDDETGDTAAFLAALDANGVSHGLLVQPSCYGFDNSAMLDAIAASNGRLKGIAVVEPGIASEAMRALQRQGVVGVRLNIGSFDPDFFRRPDAVSFIDCCADVGWFVEIYAVGEAWTHIAPVLSTTRAPIIIDHLGHPELTQGIDQRGFRAVLSLAERRNVVVKLSSFFRVSLQPLPHADLDPFASAVLKAFGPDRCVWGSDWPFINTRQVVRYGEQLACLERWLPNAAVRRRILWDTPARLFGFGTTTDISTRPA